MLEGINILSEVIKWSANGWDIFGGIFTGLITLLFLALVIWSVKNCGWEAILIMPILIILIAGFASITCFVSYANRTLYKEYKATIDDNVSLTEFNEKYEIVDQEGKIYTIREKLQKIK